MRPIDLARLILLSAIWGGSFVFLRILAPAIGPVLTAELRVSIAGLALLLYFRVIGLSVEWSRFWKKYLVIGAISTGIPFLLFSFAALHMPASYQVILNATSPLFGAVFSALWLGEAITLFRGAGLLTGAIGVALVAKVGAAQVGPEFKLATAACLGAAVCYGLTGIYMRKFASETKPAAVAGASQVMAGLLLLPLLSLQPGPVRFTPVIVACVLGASLVCSAIAYLLYYRLMADVGPTRALTVTFVMPVFGMLWGALFLGEIVTPSMIAGCGLVIVGTGAVFLRKGASS